MASWTLTTSGAALLKAGAGRGDVSGALLLEFSDNAEAQLAVLTRKDWVAAYSSLGANFKKILGDTVSDAIAIKIICYDMSGYTSRAEAQTMLDVLTDNYNRNVKVLSAQEYQEVMD